MKRFVSVLLVCMMLMSVFGALALADDKVVLQFYLWNDEEPYIKDVVSQYNASQDKVEIVMNVIPSNDYDDKLKVLLAGGSDIDIYDIRGMAQVVTFAETENLLNLDEYIKNSGLVMENYGEMLDLSYVDGSMYALPARSTCWVLFYNADLFDKAGLPYPGQLTWDEYGDLAVQLKEKTGVNGGFWVPWIYPFASVQAGKWVDDADTSYLQKSLELLNRFYNVDKSHMSYAEMTATSADYIEEFESGAAAMLPNGEWCVQMLMEDEAEGECDINWQIAPMPVCDGVEPGATWGQFQYMGINSKTAHPDEAFDFLKYLCGAEGSAIYSQHGMIHAYAGEEALAAYKETVGKDCVSVFFDAKKVCEQPNHSGYAEVLAAFNEQAQLYLLGEKSIEDTMADFISHRDAILAQNK
ncbi:MAG: sugar ABC transporter substrate-binding protein [Eubacterium sp.]|nr:sugar ABC transporter substrate-binding protein [Eubacterium sp.]MBR2603144.1 sugar ABC transporter substrate-binding protein [Clostridia bacterium]